MRHVLYSNRLRMSALATCLVIFASSEGWAADTTEPFEIGATNVDFYGGADGLGLGKYESTLYLDAMIGYGITSRLSYYLGTRLYGNEYFGAASGDLYTGLYGTPVDTEHFDLDLFLGATLGGLSSFSLAPGAEFNFDVTREQALFGFYLRIFVPITGEETVESTGDVSYDVVGSAEVTLGTYLKFQTDHMIHLEYDMVIPFSPESGAPAYAVEGIALGYNVVVHENVELINQLYLDIPQSGETVSVGLMAGFIATVP